MLRRMKPSDLQIIGAELAIKWDDGEESFVPLNRLREACPCAACKGEVDVLGHRHMGPTPSLTPNSFEIRRLDRVGGYGLQPIWADGHSSGIFSFQMLRGLATAGA